MKGVLVLSPETTLGKRQRCNRKSRFVDQDFYLHSFNGKPIDEGEELRHYSECNSICDPDAKVTKPIGNSLSKYLLIVSLLTSFLTDSVFTQSLHWSNNGSILLTNPTNLINMLGGVRPGNTTTSTVLVDLQATNTTSTTCTIAAYTPDFNNETMVPVVFSTYCPTMTTNPYITINSAMNVFSTNHMTGKVAFITMVTNTTFKLSVPQYSGTSLSTTIAYSDLMYPPAATAIEAVIDIDNTTKVMVIIRGSLSNPTRAHIIDVSGSTLTAGSPLVFPNFSNFMALTSAITIASQKLFVIAGMTYAPSFPLPTKNFYLQFYDIYTNMSSFTFVAAWQQSSYMVYTTIADNLNGQDYIYTMILDTSSIVSATFNLGMLKISAFKAAQNGSTTAQTGDIFNTTGLGARFQIDNSAFIFMNAGTFNYIMTMKSTLGYLNSFTLYPKDLANFGASLTTLTLPAFGNQTKPTNAYGFFAYGPSEAFSLYYQTTIYSSPLIKATLFQCQAGSSYFSWVNKQCYLDSASPPSGYRKNSTLFEYEACAGSNCATCPDSAATCTNCLAGFSLQNNVCIQCNVALCSSCDTTNHCVQCTTGYLISASTCPPTNCDTVNGYSYNSTTGVCAKACTAANCTTCHRTDGTQCDLCKTGWLNASTCTTCDSTNGYSMVNGTCVIPCAGTVSNCMLCATNTTCQTCKTGYLGSTCSTCDTAKGYLPSGNTCVLQCPTVSHCNVCATNITCQTCATGYLGSTCSSCDTANGFIMVGNVCAPQCPSVSNCNLCATTTTCQTCATGYLGSNCSTCDTANGYTKVGNLCVLQCPSVSNCNVCATMTTCQTCATGYLGSNCSSCDNVNGYFKVGSLCVLQCTGIKQCNICATGLTCSVCNTGYSGSQCDSCATGFLPQTSNLTTCIPCSIPSCTQCSSANICSQCSGSLLPSSNGSQCMTPIDNSCYTTINNCTTCLDSSTCSLCNNGFTLSADKKSCSATSCAVEHCSQCQSDSLCLSCESGFQLSSDQKTCTIIASQPISQDFAVYTQYDIESQVAFVQLNRPATDFDLQVFTYNLTDKISGEVYACPQCSASLVQGYSKALQFQVSLDVELLSATLQASYPLSSVKSSNRILQGTGDYGFFTVDNLVVKANNSPDHDKMAYGAFTTINLFRFLVTITLGFLNTVHAFWSTNQFSWMQLWSFLPGKFLTYPNRLAQWNSKWYLFVVNFGDPFKNYRNWNSDGTKCTASPSYPTNQLGCSFFDNFGQNFIILVIVFFLCSITTGVLVVLCFFKQRQSKGSQYLTQTPPAKPQESKFPTSIGGFLTWIWYRYLGLPYFVRFLDSLQPSLMFFSLMQFATYMNTAHIGLSTFFSVVFFLYYMAAAVISVFLARKVWMEMRTRSTKVADLAEIASDSGWMHVYSFYYLGFTRADYFWQLLQPLTEYTRIFFNCIFLVALRNSPKSALGLILVIELLRAVVLGLTHKLKSSLIYTIQDYIAQSLYILYIILKIASNDSYSEKTIQMHIGLTMAVFWGFLWALIFSNVLIEAALHIWPLIQKYRSASTSKAGAMPPVSTTRQAFKEKQEEGEQFTRSTPVIDTMGASPLNTKIDLKIQEGVLLDEEQSNRASPLPRSREILTQSTTSGMPNLRNNERDQKLESSSHLQFTDTHQRLTAHEEDVYNKQPRPAGGTKLPDLDMKKPSHQIEVELAQQPTTNTRRTHPEFDPDETKLKESLISKQKPTEVKTNLPPKIESNVKESPPDAEQKAKQIAMLREKFKNKTSLTNKEEKSLSPDRKKEAGNQFHQFPANNRPSNPDESSNPTKSAKVQFDESSPPPQNSLKLKMPTHIKKAPKEEVQGSLEKTLIRNKQEADNEELQKKRGIPPSLHHENKETPLEKGFQEDSFNFSAKEDNQINGGKIGANATPRP